MSCETKFSKDKKRAWLGQSYLIKDKEKKFDELKQDFQSHKTHGTSKFLILRLVVKSKKISMEEQQDCWSGIGILLYLVKHLFPNLANATRELSKANDSANPAAYKELLGAFMYVMKMKNLWLKIKNMGNSNKPWEIICFGNSDYAGDPVSKRSISDFILYVLGVSVS